MRERDLSAAGTVLRPRDELLLGRRHVAPRARDKRQDVDRRAAVVVHSPDGPELDLTAAAGTVARWGRQARTKAPLMRAAVPCQSTSRQVTLLARRDSVSSAVPGGTGSAKKRHSMRSRTASVPST